MNKPFASAGLYPSPGPPLHLPAKVHVTQKDIEDGIEFDCKACPVALALKRVVLKSIDPIVERDYAHLGLNWSVALPQEAIKWIYNFDRGEEEVAPRPFVFTITSNMLQEHIS